MTYSKFVRWFKIGLPLLALGLLSAVFLLPRDNGFDGGLIYSTADLLALGEGLTVSNPRFTGTTEEGEPFVVSAVTATPDGPDPKEVVLASPEAKVDLDGRSVVLTAATGTLLPKESRLSLSGGVTLITSDGYKVTTDAVDANIKSGALDAPGAVRAVGPQGAIEAGSFRAERAPKVKAGATPAATKDLSVGDRIWFENRVKVTYAPAPEAAMPTKGTGGSGGVGSGNEGEGPE
jgi:lipopolysaccharide export system protein LptC